MSVYRHVVLFQYKKSVTAEQVAQATKRFKALKEAIPEIAGFEWGKQCSPEGLDQGVTHCYFLTFKDKKDFTVYLKHAKHEAFVKTVLPLLEKPIVVDFVTEP